MPHLATIEVDGVRHKLFERRDFTLGTCGDPHCTDPTCDGKAVEIRSLHAPTVYAVYRVDLHLIVFYCPHCNGVVGCFRVAEDVQ